MKPPPPGFVRGANQPKIADPGWSESYNIRGAGRKMMVNAGVFSKIRDDVWRNNSKQQVFFAVRDRIQHKRCEPPAPCHAGVFNQGWWNEDAPGLKHGPGISGKKQIRYSNSCDAYWKPRYTHPSTKCG
ncbi:MAG TPA: hypothetical protein VH105_16455 [Burkholderiales bacterium]|jgi:hypothetical protein|nr:hypothetical protein [Burkholderiales bacterium]